MRKILSAILLSTLVGCSSGVVYKSLEDMPVKPDYSVKFPTPDSVNLEMSFAQTSKAGKYKKSFLPKVTAIRSEVCVADKKLGEMTASDTLQIMNLVAADNSVSSTLTANMGWKKPKYINSNMLSFDMQVITNKVIYTGSKTLKELTLNADETPTKALTLTPKIEIQSDSCVYFIVEAKRNFLNEKEYIPNSETLRIEIFAMNSKPIYASNHKANHFQVIKKLLPDEIGNTFEYKVIWNGKNNNGQIVEPGRYDVRLTIPSRPMPYITTTILEWKLSNE